MLNRNSHAGLHITSEGRFLVLHSFEEGQQHPNVEIFLRDARGWNLLLCAKFDDPAVNDLVNRVSSGRLPRTVRTPKDLPSPSDPARVMKYAGPWWRRPSVIAARSRDPYLFRFPRLPRSRSARKMGDSEEGAPRMP